MLTHARHDHLGGLTAIFDHFEVKILWIGHEAPSLQQRHLVALAAQGGTMVIHGLRGDHCELDGARGRLFVAANRSVRNWAIGEKR